MTDAKKRKVEFEIPKDLVVKEDKNDIERVLKNIANRQKIDLHSTEFAIEMDRLDPIKSLKDEFHIPALPNGQPTSYFVGNSLGLQPKVTREIVEQELNEWALCGEGGHFEHKHDRPWLTTDEHATESLCSIVGANPSELIVMNSLSTNLHLMMVPFYQPTPTRHKIMIESGAFPSDLYVVQSQIRFHKFDPKTSLIQMEPREGETTLRTEDILAVIEKEGDTIATIMFSGLQYYTGQLFDMQKITEAGHKKGCYVGFDLAHAVGNVPLSLHDWEVDFACWCSYKYLNSGPGGIGGLFIHSKHDGADLPRFSAWWGHELSTRFEMNKEFTPIPGAMGYRLSNPPVLCVATLVASLSVFDRVGISKLRNKSLLLTSYVELLILRELKSHVDIITPSDPRQRGCQLSLKFDIDVSTLRKSLKEQGFICDVRKPSVIRAAPVPLYNTFQDCYNFVVCLKQLLEKAE